MTNAIETGYSGDPPNGATITWQGDRWDLDMGTFGGMSSGDASLFVSSRSFDLTGGLWNGSIAIWSSAMGCFYSSDLGRCLETAAPHNNGPGHWEQRPKGKVWVQDKKPSTLVPPVHSAPVPVSPMPISPPANAGPGHWEHKPKGWVWVNDSIVSTAKDAMKTTAQQDIERGYTFYLCPIDEYGRELSCSTLTQAQAELAVTTAEATPIIAEDRKAGVIKPIDPAGKYGPRPVCPPPMLCPSGLSVSLNQWNAISAAILANPALGTPVPPGTTTPHDAPQGSTQDTVETVTPHVNLGVRILEGLAAIAGVFVAVKLWKAARRKAA